MQVHYELCGPPVGRSWPALYCAISTGKATGIYTTITIQQDFNTPA